MTDRVRSRADSAWRRPSPSSPGRPARRASEKGLPIDVGRRSPYSTDHHEIPAARDAGQA
ncbi:hypothetical protein [Microbispora sp. CA-102843]|uniref:hypothetical protein n=1 Tax=Microbispora sp. CA-102843 TaxID=3239952 RepID=UPI003D9315F3